MTFFPIRTNACLKKHKNLNMVKELLKFDSKKNKNKNHLNQQVQFGNFQSCADDSLAHFRLMYVLSYNLH